MRPRSAVLAKPGRNATSPLTTLAAESSYGSAVIDRWTFSTQPTKPRSPQVRLFVFNRARVNSEIPLTVATFGGSHEALELCSLHTIERRTDPAWFDNWRQGSMRNVAKLDLTD